ncbi:MAG: cytochrome bd ubiquinol oxidase subunit [Pseudonocardiales bacterium]|jgi:cytochrome d ubiquinol oxidase subunit II|nr:cytochrome bd ubiquinol oxidase subunit [Pseudonocardiales bacterium]
MVFFWMAVLLLALLTYVILDGYDLGIGTLTLFERDSGTRRNMLEVVGNVWDGNESWLILVAMGLWAGFPDAYATALPGLYLPLCLMLVALIFRGFAIEMALHRPGFDRVWGRLFGIGSLVAAFAQGVLFGGLLTGITVVNHGFAGRTWDFLGHGYALLTGVATVLLYTWAGAAQLQAKLEGDERLRASRQVRLLTGPVVLASALSASLLPIATSAHLRLDGVARWLPFAYGVLIAAGGFYGAWRWAGRAPRQVSFFAAAAVQCAGLLALLSLFFPVLVPPSVTIYSAAAGRNTLVFLTAMIGIIGPGTVAYGIYAHWVFRSAPSVPAGQTPAAPRMRRVVAIELKES